VSNENTNDFTLEKCIKPLTKRTIGDITMTDHQFAAVFDASGLRCPMPILKTKKEVQAIEVGQILKVIATDIGTKKDFPAWAERSGNEIIEMVEEGDKLIWYIKRIK
jgi:tRNA 2-thiouridine synthesizing protein A